MRFKDKVAIVAGGAQGIGQAVAIALGGEGGKVVIWDINEAGARDTEKQVTGKGGQACVMRVNVLDYGETKAAAEQVVERFGQVDFMVACVGGGVFKAFKDMTPDFWQQQLDYNSSSTFNCFKAVMEPMIKRSCGKMVAFTSGAVGGANLAGYGAGKAITESLVLSFAAELAPFKINVNVVRPGTTDTPLTRGAYAAMGPAGEKALQDAIKANPWGFNKPENVARLVLFLLSEDADRLTAQKLESK